MEIRALIFAMRRSLAGPLLVAAQVALTFAVIVNLGYVIGQLLAAATRPSGIDLDNMFWVRTQPRSATDERYLAAVQADLAYLNALPGVIAASTASPLPESLLSLVLPFSVLPHLNLLRPPPSGAAVASLYLGTDRFIDTLGLRLIAGRNFDPGSVMPPTKDADSPLPGWSPTVIVTRALARKLFPHGEALGRTIYAAGIDKSAQIIGIVDLMRPNPETNGFDLDPSQVVILPLIPAGPDAVYVIRTRPGRRDEVMARVEKELPALTPGRFISHMETFDVTAARSREGYRARIIMLGVLAVAVLLVTVVGIAGLAAFNVATRTRQLGTRRAIGARRFHILRYFLLESWIVTTGGVVPGCFLAVAAGVGLSLAFRLPRLPLYALAGGSLLLWIVGLIAVLVPALRAASVSPAVATRTV